MILEMNGMGISYRLVNSILFAHEDEITILLTGVENAVKKCAGT